MSGMHNYTRWRRDSDATEVITADILGAKIAIKAYQGESVVTLLVGDVSLDLSPDEARLYGVRLIEAAALADGDRAIRDKPSL